MRKEVASALLIWGQAVGLLRPLVAACAAMLCCVPSVPISASEILYDTFRYDGGYSGSYGYFVRVGEPVGARFLVQETTPVMLDSITIATKATYWGGGSGPASIRVTLRENAAQDEPGTVLDTIDRNDIQPSPPTYAAGTYSFASVLHPLLTPNTPCWVVVENLVVCPSRLY